jgi:hypothetical protein
MFIFERLYNGSIMKKIILGIQLMFLSIFLSFSQDFVYPIGQHLIKDIITDDFQSFSIDILTPTSQDITYHWEVVSNTFPEAWSASLCDYGGCAAGVPENGEMYPITESEMNEGTHGFFKLNMICGFNYGQGKLEVYVYDSNNYAIGDTVSWDLTWENSSSLDELNENSLLVFPIPTAGKLQIQNANLTIQNVQLLTLSGSSVLNQQVNAFQTEIETNQLQNGIYFLWVTFVDGSEYKKKVVLN